MANAIADLFVNLGVKGDTAAIKSITAVQTGLVEISTSALEAKAAVLALFYGLEQLAASSGRLGLNLQAFGSKTGLGTDYIQRLSNAAQMYGANANDMGQTIYSLQQTLGKIKVGEGAPKGLQWLYDMMPKEMQKLGELNPSKTYALFDVMVKWINEMKRRGTPWLIPSKLAEAGWTEGAINAGYLGAFSRANENKIPQLTNQEQQKLIGNQKEFVTMGLQWETEFNKLMSEHGSEIIPAITELSTALLSFAIAANRLADALGVFNILEYASKKGPIQMFKDLMGYVEKKPWKDLLLPNGSTLESKFFNSDFFKKFDQMMGDVTVINNVNDVKNVESATKGSLNAVTKQNKENIDAINNSQARTHR